MDHDLGFYIVLGFIIVGLQNLGRHIMESTGKVLTRQLCSLLLKHRMGYVNTHYLRPRKIVSQQNKNLEIKRFLSKKFKLFATSY